MNLDPNYRGVTWDGEETNADKIGELFIYTRSGVHFSFDFYPQPENDTLFYGTVMMYLGMNMFMLIEHSQKLIVRTDLSGRNWDIHLDPISEEGFPQ